MSSSDSECSVVEPVVKKVKCTGAFKYKTKFSEAWKQTWPFISSVACDPHCFKYNLCDKTLSSGHQEIADVKDHIATQSHQKLAKSMKSQQKLHFTSNPLKDKICCSYYICHIKSVKLSSLHWVLWNFMPPIKNSWIDSCFHAFDLETNVTKVWLHSYSDSKALSKTCAKPYILFYCIDHSCRSESNQLHGGTQYSICCLRSFNTINPWHISWQPDC